MMKQKLLLNFCLLLTICTATVVFNSCNNNSTSDAGVVINGVKWATRNVATPGTFATNPEDAGMFYQWNRKTAWPAVGDITDWDSSIPTGTTWEKANDPSPAGWRVPTETEIKSLLDTDKVYNEWTTINGVNGRKFIDKATGNSLFLAAVGYRSFKDGTLRDAGEDGGCWSSVPFEDSEMGAYHLFFYSDLAVAGVGGTHQTYGLSVRCVAE
jgi:uncharacterized protein (TIGR02145 family)